MNYMGTMNMKKKIVIGGSILAVVIIVFTSFTSVVGFQSAISNSCRVSPLFGIRVKRAISDETQDAITFNYLGKGKSILSFPIIDSRTAMLQNFIDKIGAMSDEAFNRFIDISINKLLDSNQVKEEDILKIIDSLQVMRDNPVVAKRYVAVEKFLFHPDAESRIVFSVDIWIPGCLIILSIWYFILWFVLSGQKIYF